MTPYIAYKNLYILYYNLYCIKHKKETLAVINRERHETLKHIQDKIRDSLVESKIGQFKLFCWNFTFSKFLDITITKFDKKNTINSGKNLDPRSGPLTQGGLFVYFFRNMPRKREKHLFGSNHFQTGGYELIFCLISAHKHNNWRPLEDENVDFQQFMPDSVTRK